MFRRRAPLAALVVAACAQNDVRREPLPAPAAETAPTSWRNVMRDVGVHHRTLENALVRLQATDLRAAASAAGEAARLVRLGYGSLEDRAVPGFARMSLEAESWLLRIELEARQSHGDIARGLFLAGERHCTRCHDGCLRTGG